MGRETPLEEGEAEGAFERGFQWHTVVTPYELAGDTEGTTKKTDWGLTTSVGWKF